jgi:N-methylhydantoinase A
VAELYPAFRRLEDEARAVMADTGLKLENAVIRRLADGRFMGQGFDLVVALPDGPYDDGADSRRRLTGAFETAYREKFALTPPGVPVEFLNIRVAVRARLEAARWCCRGSVARGAASAQREPGPHTFTRRGGFVDTAVYDRQRLGVGRRAGRTRRGGGGGLDAL